MQSRNESPIERSRLYRSVSPAFLNDAAKLLVAPSAAAAYYYLSRRFTEAYYGELGIPSSLLEFDFADYLFAAGNSLTFVFLGLISYLFASSLWTITKQPRGRKSPAKDKCQQVVVVIWALLVLVLLVGSSVVINLDNPPAQTELIFFVLTAFGLPLSAYLFINRWFQWLLKNKPLVMSVTVLVGAIAMAGFLIIGPESWGSSTARADGGTVNATKIFHKVTFTAEFPAGPTTMQWTQEDGGIWHSSQYLLLLESGKWFWVRDVDSKEYVFGIPSQDIQGLTLQKPD